MFRMKDSHAEIYEMLLVVSQALARDARDVKIDLSTPHTTFTISLPSALLGEFVGMQEQNAQAIRTLAKACARKYGEAGRINIQAKA